MSVPALGVVRHDIADGVDMRTHTHTHTKRLRRERGQCPCTRISLFYGRLFFPPFAIAQKGQMSFLLMKKRETKKAATA